MSTVFGVLAIIMMALILVSFVLVIIALFRKDKDYEMIKEMCNFILLGCFFTSLLTAGYYAWDDLVKQLL